MSKRLAECNRQAMATNTTSAVTLSLAVVVPTLGLPGSDGRSVQWVPA